MEQMTEPIDAALDLHSSNGSYVQAPFVVRHCLEVVEWVIDAYLATVLWEGQPR